MLFRDQTDAYGRTVERNESSLPSRKRGYEKYLEGYQEVKTVGEDGQPVWVTAYTGALYRSPLSTSRQRGRKILYALLLFSALLLLICSLALPVPSNHDIACFSLACLPLLFCILLLFALFAFIPSGKDLKLYEYKSGSRRLVTFSLPALLSALLSLLASPVLLMLRREPFTGLEVLRLLMQGAAGACLFIPGWLEKHTEYVLHN